MINYYANLDSIIIYGASRLGEHVYRVIVQQGGKPSFFCDRAKAGETFMGIPVLTPEALTQYISSNIFLAVGASFYEVKNYLVDLKCKNIHSVEDIIVQEVEHGLKPWEREHYKNVYEKAMLYHPESENIDLFTLDLVVTERCSLRCRDCSNLMQYYDRPCDYDLNSVYTSFDRLLESVNSVLDLRIIGGETLMHKDVHKIIERYCEHPKIFMFSIFTNATILPRMEQLDAFKNPKVIFSVTDYGTLSRKKDDLVNLLEKSDINYSLTTLSYWQDLGGLHYRGYSEEELENVFADCYCNNFPTLIKGKLYGCPYAGHGANLEAMPDCDYVDFNQHKETNEYKGELKRLLIDRKYLNACAYCSGRNIRFNKITPAIQAGAPLKYERFLNG